MTQIVETETGRIRDTAKAKEILFTAGLWALHATDDELPDLPALLEAFGDPMRQFLVRLRPDDRNGYAVVECGERLLTIVRPSQRCDAHAVELAEMALSPELLDQALARARPVYASHQGVHASLAHSWETLLLPVRRRAGDEMLGLQIPLEYRQEMLWDAFEANPSGIFAARAVRDEAGSVSDFSLFLANEVACRTMRASRDRLVHVPLSRSYPHLRDLGLVAMMCKAVETGKPAVHRVRMRIEETDHTYSVHAVGHGDGVVVTLSDVSEYENTKSRFRAEHRALRRANDDLLRQREDLRATAESLEIAKKALDAEIKRRAALESRLRYLAEIDSMSGLANRRHFLERATAELRRANRYDKPLALVMIDIDHFKAINDRYGHAAGDLVIQSVAQLCVDNMRRDIDFVGRLGGEEFAVVMPETSLAGARRHRNACVRRSTTCASSTRTASSS